MTSKYIELFKKTWWAVLAYAVVVALCLYFRIPNKGLHDWGEENQMASFVLQTTLYLLAAIVSILAGAAFWSWINKRSLRWNLKRYLVISIIIDLVACVIVIAASLAGEAIASTLAKTAVAIVAVGATLVVLLPFGYVQPRMMLLEEGEKLSPWRSYTTGFRHSGGIFMLGFLGTIITGLVACILFIPAAILGGAQTMAQLGALDGDPLGTPSYFTPLLLVVTAALLFVFYYVSSWLTLAYAYLYGAYKTQETERKQMEKNKLITSYQQ